MMFYPSGKIERLMGHEGGSSISSLYGPNLTSESDYTEVKFSLIHYAYSGPYNVDAKEWKINPLPIFLKKQKELSPDEVDGSKPTMTNPNDLKDK
jgi:hypothetical protein